MPLIDFDDLLIQADQLRDSARVDQAISAYQDIVQLATDDHETFFKARALHGAGVAAKESILDNNSSYYRDAMIFLTAAKELYRSLADQRMVGAVDRDMAICADYAADYPTALTYFQKAIATFERSDFFGELAITYDKIGRHFSKIGRLDEAKMFIDRALQIFKKEPTAGFFRATTLLDGAKVKFQLGRFEAALDQAKIALSWFQAEHPGKNYLRRQAELYGLISAIETELGENKAAIASYDRYRNLVKNFDPLAIKVVEQDLNGLAR